MRRFSVSAQVSRPQGAFRPQRLKPRYAPLLNLASRVPGGLHRTTTLLRPIIKDRNVSTSDSPSLEQLHRAKVAISGYPRTGTTYLQHLINVSYQDSHACWKNHDALALTYYVANCAIAGITLREPQSTVISNAIYHGDSPAVDLMRFRLKSYSAWHREVLRTVRREPIAIFRFADFTHDPQRTLRMLCVESPSFTPTELDVRDAFDQEGHQRCLPDRQRNLPTDSRDQLKKSYEDLFQSRQLRNAYDEAYALFLELDSIREQSHEQLVERSHSSQARVVMAMSTGTFGVASTAFALTRVIN
jgi:hypothetical protein